MRLQKEGYVSLWFGNSKSLDDYNKYIDFKYSEDGDFISSQFAKDFNISYFDEDFFEVDFFDEPMNDLKQLLEGFSYDKIITSKFIEIISNDIIDNINSVILLYNFKFDGKIKSSDNEINSYKFIGSVTYK